MNRALARARWPLALLLLAGLVGVVLWAALRDPSERTAEIPPARLTAVAATVQPALAEVQSGAGAAAGAWVGEGLVLGNPPVGTVAVEARRPDGTVVAADVVVDQLRGIAAATLSDDEEEGASPRASLRVASSDSLRPGDEVVLVGRQGSAPTVVRFLGPIDVPLVGGGGFSQRMLELDLALGEKPSEGLILDSQGRLVAVVAPPERQVTAAPGRLFAVPIENSTAVLRRLGLAAPTPAR
jgi:hypothetical protein